MQERERGEREYKRERGTGGGRVKNLVSFTLKTMMVEKNIRDGLISCFQPFTYLGIR